jgi:hypothetical protein
MQMIGSSIQPHELAASALHDVASVCAAQGSTGVGAPPPGSSVVVRVPPGESASVPVPPAVAVPPPQAQEQGGQV